MAVILRYKKNNLILLLLTISFLSCNKDKNFLLINSPNSRIVGTEEKTIIFKSENNDFEYSLFFPANTVNEETVIDIEVLDSDYLSDYPFENNYLLSNGPRVKFYPKDLQLNNKVKLTIPYNKIENDTIYPDWGQIYNVVSIKENLNNTYEINEVGSLNNEELGTTYEFDNFENIYSLAKPFIQKADTVSLKISGDINIDYSFIDNSKVGKIQSYEVEEKNMVYKNNTFSKAGYYYFTFPYGGVINRFGFAIDEPSVRYYNFPLNIGVEFVHDVDGINQQSYGLSWEIDWENYNYYNDFDPDNYILYTHINIYEYSDIGKPVKGTITGILSGSDFDLNIDFNFSVIRVR